MCYQIIERYAGCRCLYHKHPVDPCRRYSAEGHPITEKTVLAAFNCPDHGARIGKDEVSNLTALDRPQVFQAKLHNKASSPGVLGQSARTPKALPNATSIINKPSRQDHAEYESLRPCLRCVILAREVKAPALAALFVYTDVCSVMLVKGCLAGNAHHQSQRRRFCHVYELRRRPAYTRTIPPRSVLARYTQQYSLRLGTSKKVMLNLG